MRHKVENLQRGDEKLTRIRMDIRHCYLPNVPGIIKSDNDRDCKSTVIMAKHLCGVATDLALRSLETLHDSPSSRGVAIATCCHHACCVDDYVGMKWLLDLGFTRCEFKTLCSWSGWSNVDRIKECRLPKASNSSEYCDHEIAVPSILRPKNITPEDMAAIGKMAKRTIDHGRIMYLRSLGFDAMQQRYCDPSYSPECTLLIARSKA